MAKRYGRKRRAKHLAEIAHLRERLRMESTRDFYAPAGDEDDVEDILRVVSYRVAEEGGVHETVRRDAQLTVYDENGRLLELYADQPVVRFRGTRYLMRGAGYDTFAGGRGRVSPMIEISLTAVA